MTALVLAGHGSHISPHTAGLVWSYVDQLRAWGVADEVTACFWKESPSFEQVFDTLESTEIVVVPVFTATGYFSATVIPAEMNLHGAITRRDGRTIHYTRTLGEHPSTTAIVRQRVEEALAASALAPDQVAVAVIGHGTRRSPESRIVARQQADRLRAAGMVAEVVDVYLDDDPDIPSIYTTTQAPMVIAVPFFLAPGSHVGIDVPAALGIPPDSPQPASVKGRTVYYTDPVGTDEVICRLILELARDTGLAFDVAPSHTPWQGFPAFGAAELIAAVQAAGVLRFGQLELTPAEVRPLTSTDATITFDDPARLRAFVRENPFRPLATSCDLPGGWKVPITAPHMLPAVVETVYPGALVDWARNRSGSLVLESLETLSQRQTGMFQNIHHTPSEMIEQTVSSVCGGCVRHATWHYGASPVDSVPCKAPCNLWLSRAKEAAA